MINPDRRQFLFGGASLSLGARPAKATDSATPPSSSPQWQVLKIGAGGFLTGSTVAHDNTYGVRTDTYGAYLWNPNAQSPKGNAGQSGAFQQLVHASSVPASLLSKLRIPRPLAGAGVYEFQIAPTNSEIMYLVWQGYLLKSINQGANWVEVSGFRAAPIYRPNDSNSAANDGYRAWSPKMAISSGTPNIAFVGTLQNGVYASTDGTNFSQVSTDQLPLSGNALGKYPGFLLGISSPRRLDLLRAKL